MKALYWGTIAIIIWVAGCWCSYFALDIRNGLMSFVILFSFMLISVIPVAMFLHESDVGRVDELKKEVKTLEEKLKKYEKS